MVKKKNRNFRVKENARKNGSIKKEKMLATL